MVMESRATVISIQRYCKRTAGEDMAKVGRVKLMNIKKKNKMDKEL